MAEARYSERSTPRTPMPFAPQLMEYDDAVLRIARRLSLEAEFDQRLRGRFTMQELRDAVEQELGIVLPRSPRDGPVGRLTERGEIVQYPAKERAPGSSHGNGTQNVYRAHSVDRVRLREVMELATKSVDPAHRGRRGRKRHTVEARHLEKISPAQYAKIRTMARHVAFYVAETAEDEQEAYELVHGAYLMWDPADGLDGDWRPFYDLVRASRPPANRVADDLGAAKALLDLAASHGLLLRKAASARYVIPTTWIACQEQWTAAATHPGIAAVLGVNFLLGAIAEVLGPDVSPDRLTQNQAECVVEHVQDRLLADGSLNSGHKTSVRRSIRRLMETGLFPRCDVNAWDYRQRHRMAAWSSTVTDAIAGSVASEHRGTGLDRNPSGYSAWNAFPFPVLADRTHPYSLARAVDFHCAKGRERDRLGLRGLGSFPLESARGDSNLTSEYWSEATVRIRLGTLAMYVGWIQRYKKIDLATASLADLFTLEHLTAYVDDADAGKWSTPDQARRALVTIGLIASPCLQDEALKAGQPDIAEQFFAVSCLATGKGRLTADGTARWDGRPLYKQLGERDGVELSSVNTQKAQAEAVEAAFREALGVEWAYDGMVMVYEAAQAAVLESIGVPSTTDLLNELSNLSLRPKQLEHLRALSLFNLSLAAPLRTATQRALTIDMVIDHHGRRWDLAVPAQHLKQDKNGDYNVNLWKDEASTGFDADLMRTYTMGGGVHHQLLNPNGGNQRSDFLWVNSCARPNTKRTKVLAGTLNNDIKTVIKLAASRLGLNAQQVRILLDAVSLHSFRHAVAGRLVADGRIEDARILLHHKGYKTLLEVYAANNRNVSIGGLRREITTNREQQPISVTQLARAASPAELAELRTFLHELDTDAA